VSPPLVPVGLAAVLVAGFVIRLGFWRVHQVIERDGVLYASVAEHLARAGRLVDLRELPHTFYPPAYPALIAPVYLLLGDSRVAGQVVSLAAGMAVVLLTFVIGRRAAGPRVGLVAAALTAMYPALAHAAVSVHTESVYALLLCLVILAGIRLARGAHAGHALLAGALTALAYLTRPEGLLLALVFGWIVAGWLARGERPAAVAGSIAAFLLALALLAAPYVIYLHATTGHWTLTGKGQSYRVAESPERSEEIKFGGDAPRPWRGVATEVAVLAERYARNFMRQEGALVESASLLVVMLAAVGLAAAIAGRGAAATEGVLLAAVAPLALYPAFEVVSRWLEPYMVVVFVYAARGIVVLGDAIAPRARAGVVVGALLLLVAGRYGPQLAIPLRYTPAFEPVEQRTAGRWILARFGAGTTVMTRVPEIAYYARARWVPLPVTGIDGLADAARRAQATVIALDEPHLRGLRPELLPLLDGVVPPGLALLYETEEFPRRRIRLFEVAPP
jgi:4-amino-4-deoxy-L-arabinose transferase-like glycosyltransferase